jgi:hypothetical protein
MEDVERQCMVLFLLELDWKDDSSWSDGRSKGRFVDSLLLPVNV